MVATLRKQRPIDDEDFVMTPNVSLISEESEDDFESGISNVKLSLRKLHKRSVVSTGRIALKEVDIVQLKNQVGLVCPRSIQNQVIAVNKVVELLLDNVETLKIFDVLKNELNGELSFGPFD